MAGHDRADGRTLAGDPGEGEDRPDVPASPPEIESTRQGDLGVGSTLQGETLVRPDESPGITSPVEEAPTRAGRGLPTIPGYNVEAELGRGGMGVVYRARSVRLNRTVAIKMILAGDHAGFESSLRFLAEAESIARIQHPNIVQIFHIDDHQGRPYFEMEYVGGGNLADRLDGQPRPAQFAARFVAQLTRAVEEAHRMGIVHRDLKPSNILLTVDGTPKVADFGLAKRISDDSGLTRTDSILGSPSYMSPEQAEGKTKAVGEPSDVYSLGAILYEQLTGRPPFVGATVLDTLQQVKLAEPVSPSRLVPGIPRDVETIALKCLEKSPSRRYLTAKDLADDLDRFADNSPILARPVSAWERGWKWTARRPAVAALGLALVVLSTALVAVGLGSYIRIQAALKEARDGQGRALIAQGKEEEARKRADASRERADSARDAALAETYRASISEARSLRAAHQPGWRHEALGSLARLATLSTPRRDLIELRSEAVACLSEFDVREIARLDDSQGIAFGLDFLADGRTLATAHRDGVIRLWDVTKPSNYAVNSPDVGDWGYPQAGEPWPLVKRRPDGLGLVHNPKGSGIVSLGVPDLKANRPPIHREGRFANGAAFDAGGRRLAVGWSDNIVEVFDVATGSRLISVPAAMSRAFALSPDGRSLAVTNPANSIQLFNLDAKAPPVVLGRHRRPINAVAFSPDGETLATGSEDNTVGFWDIPSREWKFSLLGHKEPVNCLDYSPDGTRIVTGGADHTARIWDAGTGRELAVLDQDQSVVGVAFSPDGEYLATSSVYSKMFRLYRLEGVRERRRLAGHASKVERLLFHPRRPILASADIAGRLILWDRASGRPIRKWQGHQAPVYALAFNEDGSILATGDASAKIHLWSTLEGGRLQSLLGQASSVTSLLINRDGSRIYSGDERGTLRSWEAATGQLQGLLVNLNGWIQSMALSEDEGHLLVQANMRPFCSLDAAGDGPARMFSEPDGIANMVYDRGRSRAILATQGGGLTSVGLPDMQAGPRVEGHHEKQMIGIALSPDGALVATGGWDGRVVLSDGATLRPLARFPRRAGRTSAVSFDSSGNFLAVGGNDLDVELLDIGLIRSGLEAIGLAWDRPVPVADPSLTLPPRDESPSKPVPLIVAERGDPPKKAVAAPRTTLRPVGVLKSRRQLAEAADLVENLIRRNPDDHDEWVDLASLRARLHDGFEYDRLRPRMLAKFGATQDPSIAERTAKACLLLPGDQTVVKEAARLANFALGRVTRNNGLWSYYTLAAGLARYRQGQYTLAEADMRAILAVEQRESWNVTIPAHYVLAMALARSGRSSEAEAEFDRAAKSQATSMPKPTWLSRDDDGHDQRICEVLQREADLILHRDPAFPANPFAR